MINISQQLTIVLYTRALVGLLTSEALKVTLFLVKGFLYALLLGMILFMPLADPLAAQVFGAEF
jgi:hypothetical protein